MPIKENVLLNTKSGKPFVTKKGKKYFVEKVEYKDDINLLLNAIKEVKEVKYDDLFDKELKTKEDYWKRYFNYQWNDGGLILWHNPTEMWNQELTRRGELKCSKCGALMVMHYRSYCPICEGVKKVKGESYYDYHEMEHFVEAKYGFKTRDYHNFKFKVKNSFAFNADHQHKWEEEHFPILKKYQKDPLPNLRFNSEGKKFFDSKEGNELWNKIREEYRKDPEGEAKEIPYMDFWHFMLDNYFGDISNGCIRTVNWKDVRDCVKEDWQGEIVDCFVKEFGDKDYKVIIQW